MPNNPPLKRFLEIHKPKQKKRQLHPANALLIPKQVPVVNEPPQIPTGVAGSTNNVITGENLPEFGKHYPSIRKVDYGKYLHSCYLVGEMTNMNKVKFYVLLFIVVLFQECSSDREGIECPDANCAHYGTQAEAQAAYDADPECMAGLDNDHDQIACEHISGSGGGGGNNNCHTTANCGCSNKNKSECTGVCCQWIVGEGCKCR
jgi:hypothetical protein